MGGKEETMKQADLDAKVEGFCGDRYDVQDIKETVFTVKIYESTNL